MLPAVLFSPPASQFEKEVWLNTKLTFPLTDQGFFISSSFFSVFVIESSLDCSDFIFFFNSTFVIESILDMESFCIWEKVLV